jgi:hypothetical protein
VAKKHSKIAGTPSNKKVDYVPTRKYKVDPYVESIRSVAESLPHGLFAIVCNENARYTAFHGSCASLILPPGSRMSFHTGCYVVDSCNRSVDGMDENEDWICFMGDDHVFPPEFVLRLLVQMYQKDLDMIVPVCFRRSFPPEPVLYDYQKPDPGQPDLWYPIKMSKYPKGGLIQVDAAGTAGMIVRRRVFEKMREKNLLPYFELGVGQAGEDLNFCKKAGELGFNVWADLDSSLGHVLNAALWPVRQQETGIWGCQYDFNTQGGFVLELGKERSV